MRRLQEQEPSMGFSQPGHIHLHALCWITQKAGDSYFESEELVSRLVVKGAGRGKGRSIRFDISIIHIVFCIVVYAEDR